MRARHRAKRINLSQIVTKENAMQILEWQQTLPAEEMNSTLIMECVNLLTSEHPTEIDVSEKERIWEALRLHISEDREREGVAEQEWRKTGSKKRIASRPAAVFSIVLCFLVLTASICLAAGVLPWRLSVINDMGYFEIHIVSTSNLGDGNQDVVGPDLPNAFMQKLDEHNIKVVMPHDLPKGFQVLSVEESAEDEPILYVACHFMNGDAKLTVKVEEIPADHLDDNEYLMTYEMSGSEVSVYQNKNGEYYVYDNESYTSAIWREGRYICSIVGNVTMEELTKTIDSIY